VATLSRARDGRIATRLSTTDPLLGAPLCGTPVARRSWRTTAPSTRPTGATCGPSRRWPT